MKRIAFPVLIVAIVVSLGIGGVFGFFLGVASVKEGKQFIERIVHGEQMAEVRSPKEHSRERFSFFYPSNWNIDTSNEDYDPDCNLIIESPGSAMVMVFIAEVETNPEDNIQEQMEGFIKIMTNPKITRFKKFGDLTGEGVIMEGKLMGISHTTRVFSTYENNLTIAIIMQWPDEDLRYVKAGMELIENSFRLKD